MVLEITLKHLELIDAFDRFERFVGFKFLEGVVEDLLFLFLLFGGLYLLGLDLVAFVVDLEEIVLVLLVEVVLGVEGQFLFGVEHGVLVTLHILILDV
jgi:hypothetical protein